MSKGAGRLAVAMLAAFVAALAGGPLAAAEDAAAENAAASLAAAATTLEDAAGLIGLGPAEALRSLGAPSEVFAHRGEEGWQDDVVFYYPGGLYLFWYQSRIWQVRADARFTGSFLGLRMGWAREQVVAAVARPFRELDDSLVFFLPDASLLPGSGGRNLGTYPLRLRAFFRDAKLSDLYFYRGDF